MRESDDPGLVVDHGLEHIFSAIAILESHVLRYRNGTTLKERGFPVRAHLAAIGLKNVRSPGPDCIHASSETSSFPWG